MTDRELALLPAEKIRNDEKLMSLYIEMYEGLFNYKPSCAGCTFSKDFEKFKRAVVKEKTIKLKYITMENSFKLKPKFKSNIHTYRIGNKPFRSYGHSMTEDFAVKFLTNGTKEEIKERKKLFDVLPQAHVPGGGVKTKPEDPDNDAEAHTEKRREYEEVVGKKAYHAWSIEELDEKIKEHKENKEAE